VNRVVAPSRLVQETLRLAHDICRSAPLAVAAIKEILRQTSALSVEEGFRRMRTGDLPSYRAMLASEDAMEGPRAFVDRRPPRWRGR
jgi:crotonobetainyl-CoA hydratase